METERIEYIDVLKFIGILFIYIGHYLDAAGLLYEFVFEFHVPLFFFISGCVESLKKEFSLKKKFISIMIPFYLFAIVSIIIKVLVSGGNLHIIFEYLILVGKGCVRNTFFASSLWFLSCLFVVNIIFAFIRKLKFISLMGVSSVGLFLLQILGTVKFPSYYNINSAMYYQIYFVIGYMLFTPLNKILTSNRKKYRLGKWISGGYAMIYSALLFFKHNIYMMFEKFPVIKWFIPILTALTVIWFFFIISYFLKDISLFNELGKSTLYFCGSEFMVKTVMYHLISIVAALKIENGLAAILYSFFLLCISQKYLVPVERKALINISNLIDNAHT